MPNITGSFFVHTYESAGVSGAFKSTIYGIGSHQAGGIAGYNYVGIDLDARLSSAIYGNATTVQPPALTTSYLIKY